MKTKLQILTAFVMIVTIGWGKGSNKNTAWKNQNPLLTNSLSKEDNKSSQLFRILSGSNNIDVSKDIRNAVFLEVDFNELARINKMNSSLLTLTIPSSGNSEVTFDLRDAKIVTDNFSVRTGKNEKVNYTPGLYYQGTVSGISPSLAAWSLFDNSVMAVFSYNKENYVLGLWNDKSNINKNIYILYKDSDVKYGRDFKCGTDDLPKKLNDNNNPGHLLSNQCIKIYFECEYQMFVDKGSVVNVVNYVTGMFNVVQALYNVEVINTEISEIYVWTTTDPYVSYTTSTDLLNNFQATRTTFNGNLAHLLTTKNTLAGGMAYLDVICDLSHAYGVSNIDNTYAAYPNYCWTSEVVTHELGHNFGSHHTHWCGWVGGAIDDCYPVEGGCSPGPTPPLNGGTIMSYCHLGSTGILLTNGFGTQPGNAVRVAYAAASCLTPCASPPTAGFTGTPLNSCTAPLTVTFTDQTFGATTSWAWDIDNNGTTDYVTQSPSHTYLTAGTYSVRLIASNVNGSDTITKLNYITVGSVVPSVTAAVTTGSNTICGGTSVTFTAAPVNGGAVPVYRWYLNGVLIPGATNAAYTSSTLANNDVITCGITSNAPCASPATAVSTGITMTVTPAAATSISIALASGSNTVCIGTPVTFNETSNNVGGSPVYQWQINGASVGSNNVSYGSSTLVNGDIVTCTLTSNAVCASPAIITSSPITMIVNPIVSPTVSISMTSGTNPTCASVPITFTATSVNGGTSPIYQWKKNGVNTIIGTTYTPASPANGDIITCMITSNALCLGTNTPTSAGITISVIPSPNPSVSAAITSGSNPSCHDSSATFTATAANLGTNPSYQWLLNGSAISGAQSQTYTPALITDGSVISCNVISNGTTCPEDVTSAGITVIVPPVATINFISDIDVCGGTIAATVFSSNPAGADFIWTNTNTVVGIPASGNGNVPSFNAVNTTANPVTAVITVSPSVNGCPGITSSYTITINPTPVITQNGTILTSSSAATYQWYRNGLPVAGAANQVCTALLNGDYIVIVDDGTCPSAAVTVTTSGIAQFNNDCFFTVYPNPSDGSFIVSFDISIKNTYSLKIVNIAGALIYKELLNDFGGKYSKEMNIGNYGKGVYFIYLTSSDNEIVKKIVIY